ncbi:MAG: hypothetical protein H6650_14215 [Ardenticatenales bacterium]|nr:hypothetical protein [Ardenticatenales bacterium]
MRQWIGNKVGFYLALLFAGMVVGCQMPARAADLPTLAAAALLNDAQSGSSNGLPPTFTPPPPSLSPSPTATLFVTPRPPTQTPLPIPTNTPVTPIPPTLTPSITPTPTLTPTATLKPPGAYGLDEPLPLAYYPRPADDNGWGIHWIPTTSQEPGIVDRFVAEVARMHIKWVVFLNDGTDIGRNDYLVDQLVAHGIMPVMRLYRSGILPYDGDLGQMVRHYRARGVFYFQLYNEPNVNDENHQGVSNPNTYAVAWAAAAREVVANGGYPGLGALSPGGPYDHYQFLARALQALRRNGDLGLLNRGWVSVHNYQGLRAPDDADGFLLFRQYDAIVNAYLHHSIPLIGTEGGSYHPDPQVEKEMLTWQYAYMRGAEPYYFAFSGWILANLEGGSADPAWEWQAWFRRDFVHPVVTDFFYQTER